jgi:hypothetical protein
MENNNSRALLNTYDEILHTYQQEFYDVIIPNTFICGTCIQTIDLNIDPSHSYYCRLATCRKCNKDHIVYMNYTANYKCKECRAKSWCCFNLF